MPHINIINVIHNSKSGQDSSHMDLITNVAMFILQDFQDSRMTSLMSVLTSISRATQLLDKEPSQIMLVNSLEQEFKRYLQQVHRHNFKQDRRLYIQTQTPGIALYF